MELLLPLFGIGIAVLLLIWVTWRFTPARRSRQAQDAYRLEPGDAQLTSIGRGLESLRSGSYEKAIKDLNRIIEIDSANALWYRARAKAYFELERDEEALRDLDQALKLNPRVKEPFYILRGQVLLRLGRKAEAFRDFERFLNSPRVNFDGGRSAKGVKQLMLMSDLLQPLFDLAKPLQELKDAGVLTEEEYNRKREEVFEQVIKHLETLKSAPALNPQRE